MGTENLLPEMSEKFEIVVKKLMLAKKEMGSSVKKDSSNPFHKSRYASLAAHLELCESILDSHGLILLHTGNGSFDKPLIIANLIHPESGQWIKSYFPLPNPKADSQGLGASLTYMRRYSINSLLGLTAEDDDGETAVGRGKFDKKQESQKKTEAKSTNEVPKSTNSVDINPKITQQQLDHFLDLCTQADEKCIENMDAHLKKEYNVTNYMNMNQEAYEICIRCLERNIRSKKDKTAA